MTSLLTPNLWLSLFACRDRQRPHNHAWCSVIVFPLLCSNHSMKNNNIKTRNKHGETKIMCKHYFLKYSEGKVCVPYMIWLALERGNPILFNDSTEAVKKLLQCGMWLSWIIPFTTKSVVGKLQWVRNCSQLSAFPDAEIFLGFCDSIEWFELGILRVGEVDPLVSAMALGRRKFMLRMASQM